MDTPVVVDNLCGVEMTILTSLTGVPICCLETHTLCLLSVTVLSGTMTLAMHV